MEVNDEFIQLMEQYRQPDKSVGLIEACSKNVNVFSEYMLGLRPYSWQAFFLHKIQKAIENDESIREFVAITSRQIGKSTSLAILAIWMCVFNKYPGTISNNTVFGIVSASDTQAKKLLYETKKLMRIGDRYMAAQYVDKDDKPLFGKTFFSSLLDEGEPNNTTTITFKPYKNNVHGDFLLKDSNHGCMIKSYPPTAVVLGETFTVVVIDEAGKTDKISDQFFYDYMYPTGNSTNAIRIYTSTPWVSSGFFYRLVNPDGSFDDSNVEKVSFTVEAIQKEDPKQYSNVMKIIDALNKDGKTDEVQRAYYCRFVKGEKNYFNPEKVNDVFTNEYQQFEEYKGKCDMGVDFGGQTTSRSVITISEMNEDNQIRRLYRRIYEVGKDNSLVEDIAELKKSFNIQRIIPDDCPQGDYLIRKMEELGWNVNRMNFRRDKTKKYGAFRSAINEGRVVSFADDDLKTEMLALELAEHARQSNIQHAPGYSDDLIDSFVMSCFFFIEEKERLTFFDYDNLPTEEGCPKCGSENIHRTDKKTELHLFCRDCRHKWVKKNDETSIYDTAELLYS